MEPNATVPISSKVWLAAGILSYECPGSVSESMYAMYWLAASRGASQAGVESRRAAVTKRPPPQPQGRRRREGQELRPQMERHQSSVDFFSDASLAAISGQVAALFHCRQAAKERRFEDHLLDFTAHALHSVWLGSDTHKRYPLVDFPYIRALLENIHVHEASSAQKFLLKCIREGLSSTVDCPELRKVLHFVRKPYKYVQHMAAQFGDADMVRSMLRSGSFVEDVSDYNDLVPLHYALDAGREDIAILLIDFEAQVDKPDSHGLEPLHYAAKRGLRTAANLLLQRGASGYARSHMGLTPLDMAGDSQIKSDLRKQMVEATLKDKRATLMSTLERMSWIAILLATTTFAAFMQPPRGLTDEGLVRMEDERALMRSFWVLDILAFSFSMTTVVFVVALSFPSPKRLSVAGVWLTLAGISFTLIMAVICGLLAFLFGVLLVFPDRSASISLAVGVQLMALAIVYYVRQVLHLYPGHQEVLNALPLLNRRRLLRRQQQLANQRPQGLWPPVTEMQLSPDV
ncbi:hypothetical protein PLESTF_000923200 [Pleodorina starrii]|nr:hypothetical protein PLESTF_000923200 [Pleodorina starrii]